MIESKLEVRQLIVCAVVARIANIFQQLLLVHILGTEELNGIIEIMLQNFSVQQTVFLCCHHKIVSVVLQMRKY